MLRLTRKFSQLVPKEPRSSFLKKIKDKWLSRPVVYRMLVVSSVLLAGASSYLMAGNKGRKIGSLQSAGYKYYQPSEILEAGVSISQQDYYLIGIVKEGSLRILENTLKHSFVMTDFIHEIKVVFEGILPNTLKEGETVRVQGEFVNEYNPVDFVASNIEGGHDSERTKTTYQLRSRDITITQRPI